MTASLQQDEILPNLTNQEIIEELIATDLAVQYAADNGLKVAEDEIEAAIENERGTLKGNDPENQFVRELMAQRIKMTGLTEEEFWQDNEIRYYYEKAILLGKLGHRLMEEGRIQSLSELSDFQKELLRKHQNDITIDWSLVDDKAGAA